VALGVEPTEPPTKRTTWKRVSSPAIIRQLRLRYWPILDRLQETDQLADPLAATRLPFGIKAVAVFNQGKALAGATVRELPFWPVNSDNPEAIETTTVTVTDVVERMSTAAELLKSYADKAHKLGGKKGSAKLAVHLEDALMRAMEADVIAGIQQLVSRPTDQALRMKLRLDLVKTAGDRALALFEVTFPVTQLDKPGRMIAHCRRDLRGAIDRLVDQVRPAEPGKEKPKGKRKTRGKA
jgi:hypothetical protein